MGFPKTPHLQFQCTAVMLLLKPDGRSLTSTVLFPSYPMQVIAKAYLGAFHRKAMSLFLKHFIAVRLRTHVLCNPTHFLFQLFIATMSNSRQTSFNRVIKDWPDKCHVWGIPTRSPSRSNSRSLKYRLFHTKKKHMYMFLHNICRINMSNNIFYQGIHFTLAYSTQTWNAYVAGNLSKIKKPGKIKHAYIKRQYTFNYLEKMAKIWRFMSLRRPWKWVIIGWILLIVMLVFVL